MGVHNIALLTWLIGAATPSAARLADDLATLERALAQEKVVLQRYREKLSTLIHDRAAPLLPRGDADVLLVADAPVLAGFRPLHRVYSIDGVPVYEGAAEHASYGGAVVAGMHTLAVEITYERRARSYVGRAALAFRAAAHALTRLDVTAQGGGLLSDSMVAISIKSASSPTAARR